jgi:hypothetical protein
MDLLISRIKKINKALGSSRFVSDYIVLWILTSERENTNTRYKKMVRIPFKCKEPTILVYSLHCSQFASQRWETTNIQLYSWLELVLTAPGGSWWYGRCIYCYMEYLTVVEGKPVLPRILCLSLWRDMKYAQAFRA